MPLRLIPASLSCCRRSRSIWKQKPLPAGSHRRVCSDVLGGASPSRRKQPDGAGGPVRSGDPDSEEGLQFAGHVASDRILLSYLTGIDCESVGLTGMDDILYLAGPSPTVAEHAHPDGKG